MMIYEMKNLHYNEINEILSKLYYRNKARQTTNKKFKIYYKIFSKTGNLLASHVSNVIVVMNIATEYLQSNYLVPMWREKEINVNSL